MPTSLDTDSRTAWISRGFEHLVSRVLTTPHDVHFDVLIIGSGYGGALSAATLAGRQRDGQQITVGVLERGKEYLPGAFPTGLAEVPKHLRRDGHREGLFDIRPGADVTTVTANGVGGGSLINAGVMEVPRPEVFQSGWPTSLSNLATWRTYFDRASVMLGATVNDASNTILEHPGGPPQKYHSLKVTAPNGTFRPAAITVAMNDRANTGHVALTKCNMCGDCATGCNFGAKDSLDVNLLVRAQQNGADIFSGATVLHIEKEDSGNWIVHTVYTNTALRARHSDANGDPEVIKVRAGKVIVAAGTLGSTEILLRSRAAGLAVSDKMIGKHCSTNGDMLVADYSTDARVNNVSSEQIQPSTRQIGPTISGIIDLHDTKGVLIEEISVPASLRIAFKEIFGTVNALHNLDEIDWSTHSTGLPTDDIYAVAEQRIDNTALFAVMGNDGARGHIELTGDLTPKRDGIARMHWADIKDHPIFEKQVGTVAALNDKTGGRIIPNPVWRLLPESMNWLLKDQKGPVTTVHPLGGLVMGETGAEGVVDPFGRVFTSDTSSSLHDGLVVLDGSIVPTALGTNPALTIAAVALRAAENLAGIWGYNDAPASPASATALKRPVFRKTDVAAPAPHTEVEVFERLSGKVQMAPQGQPAATYIVELTLRFSPKPIAELSPATGGNATLSVSDGSSNPDVQSTIRIYADDIHWQTLNKTWHPHELREQKLDQIALFKAPLTGTLKVLERQGSSGPGRILRALAAWLPNRGARDSYQALVDGGDGPGLIARIKSGIAIASRSGELRNLAYDLTIGAADAGANITLTGSKIVGLKRFTYARRGNPWRQLMDVNLKDFPGLKPSSKPVLTLDLAFLAGINIPLFRITRQDDSVGAIGDMIGFLGYLIRMLLGIHIWSFRAPDADLNPDNDKINFVPPAELKVSGGTVAATILEKTFPDQVPELDDTHDPMETKVRITQYQHEQSTKRPVVMLHGYSSGATTFAHHAVEPNLASQIFDTGRDVWLADLRTSPFFSSSTTLTLSDGSIESVPDTATKPWSIEQVADQDVAWVIDQAAQASPDGQVDVVAHCMGTVMFSMAALERKFAAVSASNAPRKINRAIFSQVGPLVVFTPINVFRAYATRYLIEFLPDNYQFNPQNPTLADDLLDRLLTTLPYPVEEFDFENPILPWKRTPWTRTRHRMDAIYGRNFRSANMDPSVLTYLDEHFGALSLRTVSTALHYARYAMMTDRFGRNKLVSRRRINEEWHFPTLSMHGAENGMSALSTLDRMGAILDDAGARFEDPFINDGAGHQDSLIGTKRFATANQIKTFLDTDFPVELPRDPNDDKIAYPPWIGPIITKEVKGGQTKLIARLGSAPTHREAQAIIMLRVEVAGDQVLRPDDPSAPWDEGYVVNHMMVLKLKELTENRWAEFEVPPPTAFPNHDPLKGGNATLVLLIYDESNNLFLPVTGYFFAQAGRVIQFDPNDYKIKSNDDRFDITMFQNMSKATIKLLEFGPQGSPPPPKDDSGTQFLQQNDNSITDPNVIEGTPYNDGITSAPVSDEQALQGEAVAASILGHDSTLMDGIVPDQTLDAELDHTQFMLGSCQYPAGFFDAPVASASYQSVVTALDDAPDKAPRFMILAGDQVYVDPTAGLFDPSDSDDRYRIPYENWLRMHSARTVLRSIPSFMLLDDHEITDNWEPVAQPDTAKNQTALDDGFPAYEKYQRGLDKSLREFTFDGFPFFLLDTRSARKHRKVGMLNTAKLFDAPTMATLKAWLTRDANKALPKFVVTPSMLLPRHRRAVQRNRDLNADNFSALHSDGWDGYPETLRDLLAFIAENEIKHVVFLSGDEHRGCIAAVDLCDDHDALITRVHSIHTSAMWSPFPFANAIDEDFVDTETITIMQGATAYLGKVNATRPGPGDGPTYLSVRKKDAGWTLNCRYADGVVHTVQL
ncbi:MAG: alpha/beta fold hydrolase [Pseudomonadota bacterium]